MKRSGRWHHWLYRGGRPNRVARAMNRAWRVLHSSGLVKCLVTLEVAGWRTGRIISFPLVAADYRGERYLVAMLGSNANWVLNVRAAGGRAVLRHGRRRPVRLEEVEPALRASILRRYLDLAPGARPHVPVDRHAPLEEYERIVARVPVFRITPSS
ncbi:nitroreductase family deazaflavin-dependent oxidoreductase [Nonomuraea sp. NPDC049480]|uniref:nitroreductase family deazaflavin-dependent oxidoreductase n=1 Tax=Nonomuraea sp. NPDC049480 TaxID=3364353 RepID=UPI002E5BE3BC|nr:nitroreductase family deazaflavin-dependent oxidoreductase [Nonomuraea sp.]